MAFFGGTKQLPMTTYGYQSPPGATAHGWECNNKDCGDGDEPAPKKWPVRCRSCGGQADPNLDQPWYEDARGLKLQFEINRDGDEYGFSTYHLYLWRVGQAFKFNNVAEAQTVLNDAMAWRAQWNATHDYPQDDPRAMATSYAISYDQWALADDWTFARLSETDYENEDFSEVDNSSDRGNKLRVRYFGLMQDCLRLLERPNGRSLPHAREYDKAVRHIGQATQHAMGATDLKHRFQTYMRTTPL